MFCLRLYAAWATARLHSSRLRFSYSDAVCGSLRMPRWRWLNACRVGRLNVFWRPSEKMSAPAEGFSDDLLDGAVWNACLSAMVWAASLVVTTHSSRELLARRLAPCKQSATSPPASSAVNTNASSGIRRRGILNR